MGRRKRQVPLPWSGDVSSYRLMLGEGVPVPAPTPLYSLATAVAGFVYFSGQRPQEATSGTYRKVSLPKRTKFFVVWQRSLRQAEAV
jgi:hypothetical protein